MVLSWRRDPAVRIAPVTAVRTRSEAEQTRRSANVENPAVSFSIALPRDRRAGLLARQAIRERLGEILPGSTLDDVSLAVSELVANAVLHGSGAIELRIEADRRTVRGEVRDAGGGLRRRGPECGAGREGSGLGLFIVGQVAETWGVHRDTSHVWFQIPVCGRRDGAGRQM